MKSLQQLEKEARNRRAQLNATWLDVQSQLTLRGLAKEALRHIDPHIRTLPSPILAVKRHPLLAAGALAGASWLLKQALRPMRRSLKNGRAQSSQPTRVPPANLKTLKKETIHEIN
jgi:hypothetical protein